MTYFVESDIICLIYYLFRAVFFLKQKVYTLLIVLTAIIFSASFLIAFSEDKNTNDFEVVIINDTESSETNTDDILYNSITAVQTVTKAVNTTSSGKKKTKTSSTKETQVSVATIVITDTAETESVNFPIDINSAGIDELKTLDGIGDATASKIIEYRETYGSFKNCEELLNVSGIGEKKLEKIYDFIFVENESYDEPDNSDSEIYDYNDYIDYNNDDIRLEESDFSDEQDSVPETEPTEITTEEFILINLNTALKEDFMKLPYVDENIADDIIELRNTIQYFSHPYELLMVESLTQQQVAEIIKFVTVE